MNAPIQKSTATLRIAHESIVLSGKIDGFKQHGNTFLIIEHKRRQNRLFRKVYDAERVQCLVYLYLISRLNPEFEVRCMLSETFGNDCENHFVDRDDGLIERALELMDGVWKDIREETDPVRLSEKLRSLRSI
jgi:hypothetical protein